MDILLLVLGLALTILGLVGSFLPVLPGPLTGWAGLLLLHITNAVPMDKTFLAITLGVALVVWLLDYVIPAMGTKKYGGSRYGIIGTTLGLIVGLLAPIPFGIIIGPFVGAFLGELLFDSADQKRALKAAFGSFIGFLTSSLIKFTVAIVYLGFFIKIMTSNWHSITV